MKLKSIFLFVALSFTVTASAADRKLFDNHWLFALQDSVTMSSPNFNDNAWRRLSLPHDWSIEGDFQAIRQEPQVAHCPEALHGIESISMYPHMTGINIILLISTACI